MNPNGDAPDVSREAAQVEGRGSSNRPAGRGGPRPGAGRKPDGYLPKKGGDVAFARSLLRSLMRDESQPMGLRVRCAVAVVRLRTRGGRPGRKSLHDRE